MNTPEAAEIFNKYTSVLSEISQALNIDEIEPWTLDDVIDALLVESKHKFIVG
jgi:hypothetical protein